MPKQLPSGRISHRVFPNTLQEVPAERSEHCLTLKWQLHSRGHPSALVKPQNKEKFSESLQALETCECHRANALQNANTLRKGESRGVHGMLHVAWMYTTSCHATCEEGPQMFGASVGDAGHQIALLVCQVKSEAKRS